MKECQRLSTVERGSVKLECVESVDTVLISGQHMKMCKWDTIQSVFLCRLKILELQ